MEVQLLSCFKCVQPAFKKVSILPQQRDLYRSHRKNSNRLSLSTCQHSPRDVRFVLLRAHYVTVQSRRHSIDTNVGSDNHVMNVLSNKFFGIAEISEGSLEGSATVGINEE